MEDIRDVIIASLAGAVWLHAAKESEREAFTNPNHCSRSFTMGEVEGLSRALSFHYGHDNGDAEFYSILIRGAVTGAVKSLVADPAETLEAATARLRMRLDCALSVLL